MALNSLFRIVTLGPKPNNIQNVRIFSTVPKTKKILNTPNYTKRDDEFKLGKQRCAQKLEELLNIKTHLAKELVLKCKQLSEVSTLEISKTCKLLVSEGVKRATFIEYPEILADRGDVNAKINLLKDLSYDINTTASLLKLTNGSLAILVDEELMSGRINKIKTVLEVTEKQVCEILVNRPFMQKLDLLQLENNVNTLKEYGVTKEEILKDLWALRYSTEVIKKRIELAKKNNIETFKTWMVRAQPEIFETYIKRRSDNKTILGGNSLVEYLSSRLECSTKAASFLISKHKALENKSLKKINEMIDFLYMHGFKPLHICRVPKILMHSVETTRKRLKDLEAQGTHLDTLYVLTKSQKQFMQYYETLLKSTKNKVKP